ncbi:MAG: class I SAM-dependent methyltransferase [Spirochaetaceae bacterium]|nr:class I SAM-dependent methyltransferase [Spirochaetaceae bacterium]
MEHLTTANILLVTHLDKSSGSGHIQRTLQLLTNFAGTAKLYDPNNLALKLAEQLSLPLSEADLCRNAAEQSWQLIVLDNFKTGLDEANFFLQLGRVVALDEGGEARAIFPYLIDLLPSLKEMGLPNEHNPGYLNLPAHKGQHTFPPQKILVSFGGCDEEQLTEYFGQLLDSYNLKNIKWSVIKGPLFGKRPFAWAGVPILKVTNLKEILGDYDLVITHFGLTAYEALSSGAKVVLFNPSAYHDKLAHEAGFACLGVKEISKDKQKEFYNFLQGKNEQLFTSRVKLGQPASLTDRLNQLYGATNGCPSCSDKKERFGQIIYRSAAKSYAKCPSCGLVYQELYLKDTTIYDENYFFNEYKQQYGRTYLEDFDNIKAMAKIRLKYLNKKAAGNKLLDIGCAYGAFLQAANEHNFDAVGLDASGAAINYIVNNLQLTAKHGRVPKQNPYQDDKFDVITLWYVIEHLQDFNQSLKQIAAMLNKGGLLAFATPKGNGLSAKINAAKFYAQSPNDHYFIFNSKQVSRLLKDYGFKVYAKRTTGVHPERKYLGLNKNGLLYKWLKWLYTKQGKGDTFEVYAYKIN